MFSRQIVVLVAHFHEFTKKHEIIHLKQANFTLRKLYSTKVLTNKEPNPKDQNFKPSHFCRPTEGLTRSVCSLCVCQWVSKLATAAQTPQLRHTHARARAL